MASLFDPLSVALETVKTIEGVGSHKPDPPRFKVEVPINPGEWAKKEAFQRQHNLTKWSTYNAKTVIRAHLRLIRITSTGSSIVSTLSEEPQQEKDQESSAKVVTISVDTNKDSHVSDEHEERDDDFEALSYDEEDDEESQRISKMTENQKRYQMACTMFQVTVNRKVNRFIDHYELILSMMKMSDPEFKAIMAALVTNDTVERLDLTEVRLSDKQVVYLTDMFSEDNAVTDLVLAENNLNGRVMNGFFAIIASKDNLVYLDIAGNDLRDKDAPVIADYVKTSEFLVYLYMSRNNFTEKSGEIFGKMIAENTSLEDLDISSNRLRCGGAEKFFKGFLRNGTLHKLDFSWNGLGSDGVKSVVNMLKKNSTLTYLNLAGSRISGIDLEQFYPALKKNTSLQRIVLSHNPFLMSDITSFLKELYKWTTTGLQRVDFGAYQTVENVAMPLIDLLFWEKSIDIRFGGCLVNSKETYKYEEVITKFRDDPLALVTRLRADERMKIVKYFGKIDLNSAIEEGDEEIPTESFLYKVRNNKVTYRDLANRVKRAGDHPYDVIRNILDMVDIATSSTRLVPRYSLDSNISRRLYIKSRAEEKMF